MADLTPTVTEVLPGTGARMNRLICGAAVTPGEVIYKKAADGLAYLAQADGTLEEATVAGIALNGAGIGQPVTYQQPGVEITIGSTAALTRGEIYCLSFTPGKIAVEADISGAGKYMVVLGIGNASDGIEFSAPQVVDLVTFA